MLYFLSAEGLPRIKVGVSIQPAKRLRSCQVWSPVPLHIEAVDEEGDHLTEVQVLHQFRHDRLHGEWHQASPDLLALIGEVRATGHVPNAWRLPAGYPGKAPSGSLSPYPKGASLKDVMRRFGLTRQEYSEIVGATVDLWNGGHVALTHIPHLLAHLSARGEPVTYHTFLQDVG